MNLDQIIAQPEGNPPSDVIRRSQICACRILTMARRTYPLNRGAGEP